MYTFQIKNKPYYELSALFNPKVLSKKTLGGFKNLVLLGTFGKK